jgi:phage shock protein A
MSSLFDKARVAVLGKMNQLMDKVANTPEAYKQRIRALESALADLRAAHDEAVGTVNGFKREITELNGKIARKQSNIDLLIGDDDPSNDSAAIQLQLEVGTLQKQLDGLAGPLETATNNVKLLDEAEVKLEATHQEMMQDLDDITLNVASTNSLNRSSAAAEAAMAAGDDAGGDMVDSIKSHTSHERDVADARFARVFGDLETNESPEQAADLARAKAAIEARRAQIAAQAVGQAEGAAPASGNAADWPAPAATAEPAPATS